MEQNTGINRLAVYEDYQFAFIKLIEKLPHSKSRVPFTYHHDYLRAHSKKHQVMSRSEVASCRDSDQTELYAIALMKIIEDLGLDIYEHIVQTDLLIIKVAKEISDNYVYRQNKVL